MIPSRHDGRDVPTEDRRRLADLFDRLRQLPWDCYPPISAEMDSIFDELILLDPAIAGWLSRVSKHGRGCLREDEIVSLHNCEVKLRALVARIESFSPSTIAEVECKEEYKTLARILLKSARMMLATA